MEPAPTALDGLLVNIQLASLEGEQGYGSIPDAALGWRHGLIVHAGPRSALHGQVEKAAANVINGHGRWVTPGLIDCHTHLVFAGHRADEFEQRQRGVSYEQIARSGGGIMATVRATRQADARELLTQSLQRARALLEDGVTTLEIKSGYGLELATERRMLQVARRIGQVLGVNVCTTYLGAHALPEEFSQRPDAYIDAACRWLVELHREGLVDAVDAFCEQISFNTRQTRRMFEQARALGLPVKLHADQLSDGGGAALLADCNGLSADHVEYTDLGGVAALAKAGSVAVLLPGAFQHLRQTQPPPVQAFRDHGVAMAVATDCNPGTSPLLSLRQAMALACSHFNLSPDEALRGATVNAARALGLQDRGRLLAGQRADFVLWNIDHPAELCYWLGGQPAAQVWCDGQLLASRD